MRPIIVVIALGMQSAVATRVAAQSVDSTQAVWIEVRDAASKAPVAGARVRALADSTVRGLTDAAGMVELKLHLAQRQVVTSRLAFRPDTSTVSAEGWAAGVWQVRLVPNAQSLAPVAVSGESPVVSPMMREFESRRARRAGGASFIGPEEFERRHSSRITDFLRRGVQGVKLVDSSGVLLPVSSRGEIVRTTRNQRSSFGPSAAVTERVYCVLRIAVDGIPKEWGFDLSVLDPKEIYGVEVYAGPSTVPVQYQSMGRDGDCGVILIWTRPR